MSTDNWADKCHVIIGGWPQEVEIAPVIGLQHVFGVQLKRIQTKKGELQQTNWH